MSSRAQARRLVTADDGRMVYLTCARVAGSAATRSLPAFRIAGRAGRLATGVSAEAAAAAARRALATVPAYADFVGPVPPRAAAADWLRALPVADKKSYIDAYPLAARCRSRDAPGQRRGAGRILRVQRPAVHLDQVRGGTGPGPPETGHPGPAPAGRRAGRRPADRHHQRVLDGRVGDRHQRVPRPRPAGAAQVGRAGARQGAVRPGPARPGLHLPDHRVPAVPALAAGTGRRPVRLPDVRLRRRRGHVRGAAGPAGAQLPRGLLRLRCQRPGHRHRRRAAAHRVAAPAGGRRPGAGHGAVRPAPAGCR